MVFEIISWIGVALILIATTGVFISRDWRWSLGLLALQYFAAFWLVTRHWPIGMASVKLVTGWMATTALGMTRLSITNDESALEAFWPRSRYFRISLAGIVVILAATTAPHMETLVPGLGIQVIIGSLLLIGMGLIHLGISSQVLRVTLGLLTILSGFEILYAAVESSILVAGLLAVVNLGLALTGSYMLVTGTFAEEGSP
jgi:hypothetical protein